MRKTFIPIGLGMLIALGATLPNQSYAQAAKKSKIESTSVTDSVIPNKKEEKNRNEMLNASSPSLPRQINTGIPPGGDILIMENDVPVIYTFYPQIVTSAWKYDSSIGKIGLMSLAEGALTFGKTGFTLTTGDRQAGPKFKGVFSAYTNSWGSLIYSGNISGPMGKKGWGYSLSMHETYERGNGTNLMYYPYSQRMEMFKAGINKRYKNGNVSVLFKHASAVDFFNSNQPLQYNGKGSFSEYPGFSLGQDSYTLGDGRIAYADANTGQSVKYNLGDDKFNKKISNAIYLNGEHKFGNGYRLTYASMYMHSKVPFAVQFPLTLGISTPNATNQFFLHGTSTGYTDPVQQVVVQMVEPTDIDQSLSRVELLKKFGTHNLRLAMTEQYYATGLMKTDASLYYQTVKPNPQLLDWKMSIPGAGTFPITNSDGILPISGSIGKTKINKTALYFSDDFTVGKMFDFTVGARIEKEDDQDVHDQYANSFVKDRPLMTVDFKNKFNHVLVGSFVAKVTHDFGFLGDATYNDYFNKFYDYPDSQKDALGQAITTKDAAGNLIAQTTVVKSNQIKVLFLGGGIYYNRGDKFSLVSKVTKSSKLNVSTAMDVYNPTNTSQKMTVNPVFYDISTLGWTTDIVTSPFKNFNLHYLITLQNPKYANYNVTAFGNQYSFNNTVPGLSKILMEIDPSYKLGDFRLWGSLRYFGKQYGNLPNTIYYKAWWENFAGVDYRLSRNVDFKLQVTNFLNQKGISGALNGADQITTATEPNYIGKAVTAGGIRPRTIEFTVNFKL
jgi:hypothetical protein